ncbi:Predicted permease, DMT superfamily [Mycobacteroides abscessus subsp. abscessus]|nr:Predicted permease, DMT superfamily [Mycobacteroides abscessus subsp. abscessus]
MPSLLSLLVLGIVHTGIAYVFVFSGLQQIEGQTFAVLSYIDPLTAVIISATVLKEPISGLQLFGGALVLAATFMNEYFTGKGQKTEQIKESWEMMAFDTLSPVNQMKVEKTTSQQSR